ncbi:hypothetical protein BU16DRAFT_40043 [Lophium mytilinum]|uniref:Uncharacterized protein n=1 Tax=Lophium mytilinum TaxID=390894 RepID=A0A6A6QPF3_9PEZI|nr:hypothetical protein BU16DRAFT_40043 [Lophium mytilinum]
MLRGLGLKSEKVVGGEDGNGRGTAEGTGWGTDVGDAAFDCEYRNGHSVSKPTQEYRNGHVVLKPRQERRSKYKQRESERNATTEDLGNSPRSLQDSAMPRSADKLSATSPSRWVQSKETHPEQNWEMSYNQSEKRAERLKHDLESVQSLVREKVSYLHDRGLHSLPDVIRNCENPRDMVLALFDAFEQHALERVKEQLEKIRKAEKAVKRLEGELSFVTSKYEELARERELLQQRIDEHKFTAAKAEHTWRNQLGQAQLKGEEYRAKAEWEAKILSDKLDAVSNANERLELERKHLQQDLDDALRKSQHAKRKLEVSAKEIQETKSAFDKAEKEKEELEEQGRQLHKSSLEAQHSLEQTREKLVVSQAEAQEIIDEWHVVNTKLQETRIQLSQAQEEAGRSQEQALEVAELSQALGQMAMNNAHGHVELATLLERRDGRIKELEDLLKQRASPPPLNTSQFKPGGSVATTESETTSTAHTATPVED